MSEAYNDLASAFLMRCDFSCEPEPSWVPGRKPDFFCTGPFDLWVEVKSLPEEQRDRDIYRIFEYLRTNAHKVTGSGSGIAFAAPAVTTKDAKVLLAQTSVALSRPEAKSHRAVWVDVPERPNYAEVISFTMTTRDGPIWFVSLKSSTGRYGYPYGLKPYPWHQTIIVHEQDGGTTQHPLDRIAAPDAYRVALSIDPDDRPFHLLTVAGSEGGRKLTNRERIRDALGDAVNQLKSGIRIKEAPAAVFLYQAGILVPEDEEILSALLGDTVYSFRPGDSTHGEFGFAGNAGLHAEKNTTISAVTYFRNTGTPTTFHNPFAARPLQPGIFGGREWFVEVSKTEFRCRLVEHPA